jgi:hypothetical protein
MFPLPPIVVDTSTAPKINYIHISPKRVKYQNMKVTIISLDGLLDYNLSDDTEVTFEVNLFSENFNDYLATEFGKVVLSAVEKYGEYSTIKRKIEDRRIEKEEREKARKQAEEDEKKKLEEQNDNIEVEGEGILLTNYDNDNMEVIKKEENMKEKESIKENSVESMEEVKKTTKDDYQSMNVDEEEGENSLKRKRQESEVKEEGDERYIVNICFIEIFILFLLLRSSFTIFFVLSLLIKFSVYLLFHFVYLFSLFTLY